MMGEYFNAFTCSQLEEYYNRRHCKLPVEPVIPWDEESYLDSMSGKEYWDLRKQPLLLLHEGSQTFDVLSVGIDLEFTPSVTILKMKNQDVFDYQMN